MTEDEKNERIAQLEADLAYAREVQKDMRGIIELERERVRERDNEIFRLKYKLGSFQRPKPSLSVKVRNRLARLPHVRLVYRDED